MTVCNSKILTTGFLWDNLRQKKKFFLAVSSQRISIALLFMLLTAGVTADLRIGTTGDYEPFSFIEKEKLTGIDIELLADLSKELSKLSIKTQIVKTTWPNLINDLLNGSFDIAMSGISRSPNRESVAELSVTYLVTGKTVLSNCSFKREFHSVRDLDRQDIRVIVNPGGTNESFVKNSLPNTKINVHSENITIFKALENGNADLMITDEIEARIMASRYPNLCFPQEKLFNRIEKVILMRKEGPLNLIINKWLIKRLADGTVTRITDRYLPQ